MYMDISEHSISSEESFVFIKAIILSFKCISISVIMMIGNNIISFRPQQTSGLYGRSRGEKRVKAKLKIVLRNSFLFSLSWIDSLKRQHSNRRISKIKLNLYMPLRKVDQIPVF